MLNKLLDLLKKHAHIGVSEEVPFDEQFKIRLVNRAFFMVGVASTLIALDVLLFRPDHIPYIATGLAILSFFSLLFNYYRHFMIGRVIITIILPTLFMPIMLMYGNEIRLDYTVLIIILAVFILFDKKNARVLIISYLLLLQFATYHLVDYFPRVYEAPVSFLSNFVIFSFNAMGLLLLVSRFMETNRDFQEEQRSVNQRLREQTRQLQQSNEFLERYTYITSHDLKTPIRTIFSFSELLERKLDGQTDQDTRDYLDFIKLGTLQLRGIVDGIVENAESTRSNLHFSQINTHEVLQQIQGKLKFRLEEINGQLIYGEDLPCVRADAKMVYKVFLNLIDNGLKYNKSDQPTVKVSAIEKPEYFEFCLQDNGIGIPEKYQEDIFKMFKKLNPSRNFTGSGVGLALCKRIVDLHHGHIWLDSTESEGCTFHFTLPKSQIEID